MGKKAMTSLKSCPTCSDPQRCGSLTLSHLSPLSTRKWRPCQIRVTGVGGWSRPSDHLPGILNKVPGLLPSPITSEVNPDILMKVENGQQKLLPSTNHRKR